MDEENKEESKLEKAADKAEQAAEKAAQVANDVKQLSQAAAKFAAGDYVGALKDALKSEAFRKQLKKKIIMSLIQFIIPIIVVVCLGGALFASFNKMKTEMINLFSTIGSKKTNFIAKIWEKLTGTEDEKYWIKIDEEREFIIDVETGESLAYIDEDKEGDEKRVIIQKDLTYDDIDAAKTEKRKYTVVDEYVKDLGNQGISISQLRLLGNENIEDMDELVNESDPKYDAEKREIVEKYIAEFLRADIITQQFHKRKGNEVVKEDNQNWLDGGIYMFRSTDSAEVNQDYFADDFDENYKDVDNTKYKQMEFMNYDEFMDEVSSMDGSSTNPSNLKYKFSVNPETDKVVIAKITQESSASGGYEDDPSNPNYLQTIPDWWYSAPKTTTYHVEAQEMDYRDKISKYIMPYEFLINLCEITQNPEFVYHVAMLARNTEIILTVQDGSTVNMEISDEKRVENKYTNYHNNITSESESVETTTSTGRTMTVTTEETPVLRLVSADAWNYYDFYQYKYKATRTKNGPTESNGDDVETVPTTLPQINEAILNPYTGAEQNPYWGGTYLTEHKSKTTSLTIVTEFKDPPDMICGITKSKQFLGLLRNDEGKCIYPCYNEGKAPIDETPMALECATESTLNKHGINVQYTIPTTTKTESPFNKLASGMDMLCAIMQSNTSGYSESSKLDIPETYEAIDGYVVDDDYESAYVVKMQGILDYLIEILNPPYFEFPDEEPYDKIWDPFGRDYNDVDEEDQYNIDSSYIVKTDEPGALPAVTKDQLVQIINSKFGGAQNSNAMSIADTLIAYQDSHKVNAVFLLAVTLQETSVGTAHTKYVARNNWTSYNLKVTYPSPQENIATTARGIATGSYYFTQGKITIADIGYTYCPNTAANPGQGDNWVEKVTEHVRDMYSRIGINIDSGEYAGGGGHGGGTPIPVPPGANGEKLAAMVNEAIRIANNDNYYYLWGGTGPLGYDCSGLISVLYSKYLGVNTGRTSAAMHSNLQGNRVNMSSLQAGDILWKKGHVALYIGGGQIVEAYSAKVPRSEQIRVTSLTPGRFTEAYRIIL